MYIIYINKDINENYQVKLTSESILFEHRKDIVYAEIHLSESMAEESFNRFYNMKPEGLYTFVKNYTSH